MNVGQYRYKLEKRKVGEWGHHRGDRPAQRKRYRLKHKDKIKVHLALRYAVYSGKIIKPNYCEHCLTNKKSSELAGHHESYDKPLEVIFLCYDCHNTKHGKFKNTKFPELEVKTT